MPFPQGSLSFRMFSVVGKAPATPDQAMLDKLIGQSFEESEFGIPQESEYGWCGGRHVYDYDLSFANNVFADCLHFALRIDTNKVPPAVRKAWLQLEEAAVAKGNPSGFISKIQRREVRESIKAKADEEVKSGKHRRSRIVHVLWDFSTGTLFSNASGATFEKLAEIFETSFSLTLEPVTSGSIAQSRLTARELEFFNHSKFVDGPNDEESIAYPWIARAVNPTDFFGNEFLLWLWHHSETTGDIETPSGPITAFIDKGIDLDCAFGQTGKDSLRGIGVGKMAEAKEALRVGKLPRRCHLILDAGKQQYQLTLGGEQWVVSGLRLPDVEDADTPRVLFEERIALLRDFVAVLRSLFAAFLEARTNSQWKSHVAVIRRWIMMDAKRPAAELAST